VGRSGAVLRAGPTKAKPVAPRNSSSPNGRKIPGAAVARLPLYYRALLELADGDIDTVASEQLAVMAGVNAAQVRKDLSYLGSYGTRGVGYEVAFLIDRISRELGLTHDWPVVIVGVGNLGHALANYAGLSARGFRVLALVDSDPAKLAKPVGDLRVEAMGTLGDIVRSRGITIGIIATPGHAAQDVADALVAAGVESILNFAPVVIAVPDGVSVRKVDLATELQILSFYQSHRRIKERAS